MFDATAPPKGEEQDVRYVGIWLDDHLDDENYYEDRWAPFVRLVIDVLGQNAEFRRHPRPLFEGTSFANIWGPKFGRPCVEGFFVEVPKSSAPVLHAAIRLGLGIRGILDVEEIEFPRFFGHSLATNAWIVGDVCVGDADNVPDDLGIRLALTSEYHSEIAVETRENAEKRLQEVIAMGVREPSPIPAQQGVPREGVPRLRVETLVIRTEYDAWTDKQVIPADVAVVDRTELPKNFEAQVIGVVATNLAKKKYRHEVILWSWEGFSAEFPKAYYIGITTRGRARASQLLKGIKSVSLGPRADTLSDMARPLLRWQPDVGLTRFWKDAPPPDTTLAAGKNTVALHHRIAGVVRRAAGDALDFRVEQFALQNMRRHEQLEHVCSSRMNVFVGDNATGKTTILDAIADLLRVVIDPRDQGQSLSDDDVRELRDKPTLKPEKQYPLKVFARIRTTDDVNGVETIARDDQKASREGKLASFMQSLYDRVRRLIPMDLPLCAYYGVERAYQSTEKATLEVTSPESRLAGYANALDGRLDAVPFQRWIKTMELAALQDRKPNVLLETVREAVRQCIEDCETVQYSLEQGEVILRFKDGRWEPFRQLSDGYRLTLATIADIALRCVSLNPHLGPAALTETAGIVLIDEIDLHLHPNWQRRIIDDLRTCFPRIQFFLTTHSPFIVQSLHANEIFSLDDSVTIDSSPYKHGIEDISRDVLGVQHADRSERFLEMQHAAETLIDLIEKTDHRDEKAIENARGRYLEIAARYSDDPAYLAVLAAKGAMRGIRLAPESEAP